MHTAPRVPKAIIVVGGGGHAAVLIDMLRRAAANIIGATDASSDKHGSFVLGVRIIGGDEQILQYKPNEIGLVNGVGSTSSARLRRALFERFTARGYQFAQVIHPSAVVAADVELSEGVQIMAGAVIQPRCAVGSNTIINTRAGVDHDCRIGKHVHIAPGVTLCAGVSVGDECHIGAGATVIQNVTLAAETIVGAGAAVVGDIKTRAVVCGVPARSR